MTSRSKCFTRRTRLGAAAWLLPLGLLWGCSDGSGSSSDVLVEGTWEGTWATPDPGGGQVSLSLTQHGAAVDGVIEFVGFDCMKAGDVSFTLKGPKMWGWCEQEQVRMKVKGECHGEHEDVLKLSFELASGPCSGTHGTLHLIRVGPPGPDGPGSGTLIPVGHGLLLEPDQEAPHPVTVWGPADGGDER